MVLGDVLDAPFENRMSVSEIDDWTFSLRAVAEEKKPSVVVTMFAAYGLLSAFSIPVSTFGGLCSILREAANVNGNAFHNWDHTLDSLHAMFWMMRRGLGARVSKVGRPRCRSPPPRSPSLSCPSRHATPRDATRLRASLPCGAPHRPFQVGHTHQY